MPLLAFFLPLLLRPGVLVTHTHSHPQAPLSLPVDATALQTVSGSLPGHMVALANTCSTSTLRQIARFMKGGNSSAASKAMLLLASDEDARKTARQARKATTEAIFATLEEDEKLLARRLFLGLPHFDEALAWALCREQVGVGVDAPRWRGLSGGR